MAKKPSPARAGRESTSPAGGGGRKLKKLDTAPVPSTRRLKVFRTPIGFHDAYVAAASMKAALEAWGADSNLFAQGIAEQVTDAALMKAPLASPGEVVRVARGTAADHVRAVGKAKPRNAGSTGSRLPAPDGSFGGRSAAGRSLRKRGEARVPKPDRSELDAAEDAIKELDRAHRSELRDIARAAAELERRRRLAERRHDVDRDEAVAKRDKAKQAYRRAMRAWQQ